MEITIYVASTKAGCFSYETTAAALLFTSYLLASNPRVQEKLQREIDSQLPSLETRATYDTVTELPYLEQVLCESMRVYPPIPSHIGRWAAQERTICGKEGNHLPYLTSSHFAPPFIKRPF